MSDAAPVPFEPTLFAKLLALRGVQPFDRLPAEELVLVAQIARARRYAPGEVVHPGDGLLLRLLVIIDGRVCTDTDESAGPLLGARSLLRNTPAPRYVADSVQGARALTIERNPFFTLTRECPEFTLGLLELGEQGAPVASS